MPGYPDAPNTAARRARGVSAGVYGGDVMSWKYALCYPVLEGQCHIDDAETIAFVTMCGKEYLMGTSELMAPAIASGPTCPSCQHVLVRKMLKNGLPPHGTGT